MRMSTPDMQSSGGREEPERIGEARRVRRHLRAMRVAVVEAEQADQARRPAERQLGLQCDRKTDGIGLGLPINHLASRPANALRRAGGAAMVVGRRLALLVRGL